MGGRFDGSRMPRAFWPLLCVMIAAPSLMVLGRHILPENVPGVAMILITIIALLFALGLWFVLKLIAEHRASRLALTREAAGLCISCGYDIRSSAEKCPECGYPIIRYPHKEYDRSGQQWKNEL